jgi:hypothetical protein
LGFLGLRLFFKKLFLKFYYFCLLLEKLVNKKYFPVKKKISLIFRKVFPFYFGQKIFFKNYEKFRNVILFTDYIKFGPQTFDRYIYFVLNIYFSIPSLKI